MAFAALTLLSPFSASASPDTEPGPTALSRFTFRGSGSVNYFAFDWETDRGRRNALDLERLTLSSSAILSPHASLRAEIEFEHGGTGTTLEFDRFEEFGEFEMEIEKGGEVLVEQLHVEFPIRPALTVRAGRLKIPFGLQAVRDEPLEYFGTTRSETESNLVPVNWCELGVQAFGTLPFEPSLAWTLSLVNGLDSSGFSSASWIVRGYQKRFETVNADNLAFSARLDWKPLEEHVVGASMYYGDSADNRPKPDLDVSAHVFVADAHASVERGPWQARGVVIVGTLENADLVSAANRNLSNNLNVKRTPVASRAWGASVEGGFDLRALAPRLPDALVVYARYDAYDTMTRVIGDVFDNPRWDRRVVSAGINQHLGEGVVLKAEASHRTLGLPDANVEDTFSTGLGFEF